MRLFKIFRTTIWRWRKQGLPYRKIGPKIYYKKDAIDWIRKRKEVRQNDKRRDFGKA